MWTPIARSAVVTVSIRSDSFARSSSAPGHPVVAVRHGGEERDERQLVDEPRHLGRADRRRDELAARDLDVADRLAGDRAAG